MTKPAATRQPVQPSEEGFALLAAVFLVALLTIALAIALPKVTKQLQRDREIETMHRGLQYARAVKLYYKKFGSYPPNADALFKPTNNIRFLRKKYSDPTTGKEDWKPIPVGMNKAPTVMGFFGKPLGSIGAGCGTNPLAGINSSASTTGFSGTSSSSTLGSTSTSSFGATSPTDASSNCGNGLNPSSTDASGASTADSSATNTTAATNSTTSAGTASQNGQTFGGAIMGFSPNSPKPSIMVYKTKKRYNEWEFVYDPQAEQLQAAQSALGGAGGTGLSGIGGNPSTNGLTSNGGTPFSTSPTGPGTGIGNSGSTGTSQSSTSPTQ